MHLKNSKYIAYIAILPLQQFPITKLAQQDFVSCEPPCNDQND